MQRPRLAQHLNAYAYAGNNAVTISDPSGLIQPEYNDPGNDEGGNPCGGDYFGYACEKHVQETSPYNTETDYSGSFHNLLDGCGLVIPIVGEGCDGVNAVIYFAEGDPVNGVVAGISLVSGVDWACKIKSFCKRVIEGGVNKAKKIIGKTPGGGPKATSDDVVEEIAKEKAYDRANPVKPTAPDPKAPPPPAPKGGGGPGSAPVKDSCKHSFDPATPVLKADGTTEPIADIEVGDQVLAHDPETGTTQPQPVTALHVNHDTDLTDLVVRTGDGESTTLYTTQHHPFWNETTQTWTDAARLEVGDQLRAATGDATVTQVRNYAGAKAMRDLTVATIHTYYVVAGTTPVLVHNCGGKAPLTFRGDSRGPDEVFENGFQPWGDDMNLLDHATGLTAKTSGYVSTSYSREIAGEFDSSYIYTIRSHGGVDVNVKLGAASPYPEEAELAFPGGIRPECISGCIMPNGDWVPNPRFGR